MVLPTCLLVSLLLLAPHSVALRPAIEEDAALQIEERESAFEARKSFVQAHDDGPGAEGDADDDGPDDEDDGDGPDEEDDGDLLGVQRSPDEAEELLGTAGVDLLTASEDEKKDAIAAVYMLDMIFDIMDTSSNDDASSGGNGEIDEGEFFEFFTKNLDTPENKPTPEDPRQIVLNKAAAKRIFKQIAGLDKDGGDDTIDKNEFTQLMLQNAGFRAVAFFLIHPNKDYNLGKPDTWVDITMDMWNTFLTRNGVTPELAENFRTVFKTTAGDDEKLSYAELDKALTLGKKSFLQVSSLGISFVDLLVPA